MKLQEIALIALALVWLLAFFYVYVEGRKQEKRNMENLRRLRNKR